MVELWFVHLTLDETGLVQGVPWTSCCVHSAPLHSGVQLGYL